MLLKDYLMLLKEENSVNYFQERFILQKSSMVQRVTGHSDYTYKKNQTHLSIFLFLRKLFQNKLDMNGIRQQFTLTRRETDILKRVIDGSKNTEIAAELEIVEQTVKDHLSNIYLKTATENRMGLMRTLVYSPNNQFGSQL